MVTDIVFDWGGVLALADCSLAAKKLASRYKLTEAELTAGLSEFERQFETGKDDDSYFAMVENRFKIPRKTIENALNGARATHMLEVARELKQAGWPLHLLSDQLNFRTNYIKTHNDLSFFDNLFFSSDTGFIKPNEDAFLNVLKTINRRAKDCLFIDNNLDNITAAKKLGFQTIHFINEDQCVKELKKLRIIHP